MTTTLAAASPGADPPRICWRSLARTDHASDALRRALGHHRIGSGRPAVSRASHALRRAPPDDSPASTRMLRPRPVRGALHTPEAPDLVSTPRRTSERDRLAEVHPEFSPRPPRPCRFDPTRTTRAPSSSALVTRRVQSASEPIRGRPPGVFASRRRALRSEMRSIDVCHQHYLRRALTIIVRTPEPWRACARGASGSGAFHDAPPA